MIDPRTRPIAPAGLHLPLATGFPATHAELEEHHNRMEHARNAHVVPPATAEERFEALDDYDLDVMPRGV